MINRSEPLHLARLLTQQGECYADSLAYQYLTDEGEADEARTFGELLRDVRQQAAVMRRYVSRGDRVVVMAPTGRGFITAFFACQYCEAVAVPVFPPKRVEGGPEMEFLQEIVSSTGAKLFVAPQSQFDRLATSPEGRALLGAAMPCSLERLGQGDAGEVNEAVQWSPEDASIILFTSGSTGSPKGVVLSHQNLMSNFSAFSQAFELAPSTPICTWLPNFHIAGLYTRLIGLLSASPTIVFSPHAFLNQPSLWLSVLSKYRVHMSAAPNFAYDLCAGLPENAYGDALDVSGWRMAISGGEVVQPKTLAAFCDRYGPCGFERSAFLPYFGMTETLCTTIPRSEGSRLPRYFDRHAISCGEAQELSGETSESLALVSNGPLLADTTAVIVDPQTKSPVDGTAIGELWLRGQSISPGYWKRDDLNESVCRATVEPNDGHTYFRTGDLGFLLDGELFLTGRLKDIIIVNGKNYYPTDIEASVGSAFRNAGVTTVAAFPVFKDGSEKLGLAIESDEDASSSRWGGTCDEIRTLVLRQHGLAVGSFVILPLDSLPRTRSGKLQRSECRRRVLDGMWIPWTGSEPTHAESEGKFEGIAKSVEEELIDMLAVEISQAGGLSLDTPLDSLGIDSIAAVRIITKIFRHWHLKIDYGAFNSSRSIADLAGEIRDHQAGDSESVAGTIDVEGEIRKVDSVLDQRAPEPAAPGAIFLTGATGFLGGYLLRDLLSHTTERIVCLVRARSAEAGRERLAATLENLGWNAIIDPDRLQVVCGSLDQPRLGLEVETFDRLAEDVGLIVHNGANVNFVAPYEALHDVNVASNLEILRLATQSTQKPVHFVSTIGVFNGPERDAFDPIRESDWIAQPNRLFSGYSQSKWLAESMFHQARRRDLPVSVYRPGLVMGDSHTGYCHTEDFLCRFVKGCLQMGAFPDLDFALDMTPVDFVSRAICHLISKGDHSIPAFHLINPKPILITDLARWFEGKGYPVAVEDSACWHKRLATSLPEDNALFPLVPFLLQELPGSQETILPFFARRGLNLDDTLTRGALSGSSIDCPPVGDRLLERYLEFFLQIGFLEAPGKATPARLTPASIS